MRDSDKQKDYGNFILIALLIISPSTSMKYIPGFHLVGFYNASRYVKIPSAILLKSCGFVEFCYGFILFEYILPRATSTTTTSLASSFSAASMIRTRTCFVNIECSAHEFLAI